MKLSPSNREDLHKYYKSTYIKLSPYSNYNPEMPFDADTLFRIDKVQEDRISGKSQDDISFEIMLDEENPLELSYLLPHKSCFQVDNHACILMRVPARQYKRGISPDNTVIFSLLEDGSTGKLPITFFTLKEYVNKQKFYSLSEAIKAQGVHKSVVLSSRMSFLPKAKLLMVDTVCIGCIEDNKIKLSKPQFKSEVESLLKSNNEKHLFQVGD